MLRASRLVWLTVALAGCSLTRAAVPGTDDPDVMDATVNRDAGPMDAHAPDAIATDAEMTIDAPREDAGDSGSGCSPGATTCSGMDLLECVSGEWAPTPCSFGCGGTPAACRVIAPSNVGRTLPEWTGTADLAAVSGELWLISTTTGRIDVRQTSAPGVVVRTIRTGGVGVVDGIPLEHVTVSGSTIEVAAFSVSRFSIAAGARVLIVGTRPFVLLAQREVLISGSLSSTTFVETAAGGGAPGVGPGAGMPGAKSGAGDGGGAGASYASVGGVGGNGGAGAVGGDATPAYGSASLVPLLGGSGGGGAPGTFGGRGGHGGGAVQITAGERIDVSLGAVIDVSGTGGGGGVGNSPDSGAGGGGGSGGAVLLEAPTVLVEGLIGALGGGGGQGAPCETGCAAGARGANGAAGTPVRVPAAGSATTGTGGGGGAGSDAAGGTEPGVAAANGGGGGGGVGRIRINAGGFDPASLAGRVFPSVASGLTTTGPLPLSP